MDDLTQAQDQLGRVLDRARAGEDRVLAAVVREEGERLVKLLNGVLAMARLHAPDNHAFDQPMHDLEGVLGRLIELLGAVHLLAIEDQVYVNDIRIRLEGTDAAQDLGERLRRHGVGGISFYARAQRGAAPPAGGSRGRQSRSRSPPPHAADRPRRAGHGLGRSRRHPSLPRLGREGAAGPRRAGRHGLGRVARRRGMPESGREPGAESPASAAGGDRDPRGRRRRGSAVGRSRRSDALRGAHRAGQPPGAAARQGAGTARRRPPGSRRRGHVPRRGLRGARGRRVARRPDLQRLPAAFRAPPRCGRAAPPETEGLPRGQGAAGAGDARSPPSLRRPPRQGVALRTAARDRGGFRHSGPASGWRALPGRGARAIGPGRGYGLRPGARAALREDTRALSAWDATDARRRTAGASRLPRPQSRDVRGAARPDRAPRRRLGARGGDDRRPRRAPGAAAALAPPVEPSPTLPAPAPAEAVAPPPLRRPNWRPRSRNHPRRPRRRAVRPQIKRRPRLRGRSRLRRSCRFRSRSPAHPRRRSRHPRRGRSGTGRSCRTSRRWQSPQPLRRAPARGRPRAAACCPRRLDRCSPAPCRSSSATSTRASGTASSP